MKWTVLTDGIDEAILSTLFSKKMPYQKMIDRLTELGIVLTEETGLP